jgi:hypothetical protein
VLASKFQQEQFLLSKLEKILKKLLNNLTTNLKVNIKSGLLRSSDFFKISKSREKFPNTL